MAATAAQTRYRVEGMDCAGCATKIDTRGAAHAWRPGCERLGHCRHHDRAGTLPKATSPRSRRR